MADIGCSATEASDLARSVTGFQWNLKATSLGSIWSFWPALLFQQHQFLADLTHAVGRQQRNFMNYNMQLTGGLSTGIDPSPIIIDGLLNGGEGGDRTSDIDSLAFSTFGTEKGGEGGGPQRVTSLGGVPPLPPFLGFTPEITPVEFVADGVFIPAPKRNLVVSALQTQGIYQRALGGKRHVLECPWANDHEDGATGEAIYTEPDDHAPYGQFHCPHRHDDKPTLMNLLDRLDIEPQRARGKPCIRVEAGEQNLVLAAAEHVLASRPVFFQSDGTIVAMRSASGGDVSVELANEQMLTMALSAAADWEKHDGRAKSYVRCDPPPRVCQMLMKGQEYRYLRPLKGVARQPYFRRQDGELVTQPGYDAASSVYARFDPVAFSLPKPTREAAEAALQRLLALIAEFHFASDADRSAALCAMLTASVRSSLPLAPAFNITAASSGSGKSYLTSVITPFGGPGEPFNMSYPTTSEEASKAMLAALIQAPAVIVFDDMQTDWLPHGVINRMLTSETIADRVLGASKVVKARTASFILGTGNNVTPIRDMCRRVVSIRLAPPSSAPSMLDYNGDPVGEVRRHREAYVADALTIIRAWRDAGSPKTEVPSIGSFGEWSDMCRQPLLWLGQPDPAVSLMEQVRSDPDTRALAAFMEAWTFEFAQKPMTVRKVIQAVERNPDDALAEAIMDLPVNDRQFVNPSKLGWFLKKNAERIIDGYVIRQVVTPERRAWIVVKAD